MKSYRINFVNSVKGSANNYAAGIAIMDNEKGDTGNGQRHAILKFFWDPAQVPASGVPNNTGLLHLNFSVADYAGILELLQSTDKLQCIYNYAQKYGEITHAKAIARRVISTSRPSAKK